MDQLWLAGWFWVTVGGLTIGIGGVLTNIGVSRLSMRFQTDTKTTGRLRLAWWRSAILAGALSIAVGGVLTTMGWDRLSLRTQLRNQIMGIFREWEINDSILKRNPLFDAKNEGALGSYLLYPRLRTTALNNALASGGLSSASKVERMLLRALADYQEAISDVNQRLSMNDTAMLSIRERAAILDLRKHVLGSRAFNSFMEEHGKMREVLQNNYPWATSAKFLD
jgi:hypothetical protein